MKNLHRAAWGAGLVLLGHLAIAQQPATPPAPTQVAVNIEAQPLRQALAQLAEQTGLQLIFPSQLAENLQSPRLSGLYKPEDALRQLLINSALTYEFINAKTATIRSSAADDARNKKMSAVQRGDRKLHLAQAETAQTNNESSHSDNTGSSADRTEKATESLEEVVVTAQKREESVQHVPLGITALSRETLAQRDITSLDRIAGLAPNLDIQPTGLYNTGVSIFIRGIGGADAVAAPEYPVALYVNDVPVARQVALFDLIDLERVEILRGPQGTLFGRNTTGGAVSVYTRRPSDEFGFTQRVGYGNYNSFTSRTVLDTGSIGGSSFAATLAYSHKQNDGYVRNLRTSSGESFGATSSNAVYFALEGELSDKLSLKYSANYSDIRAVIQYQQLAYINPTTADFYSRSPQNGGDPLIISRSRLDTVSAQEFPLDRNKTVGQSLSLAYDVNENLKLRSIFGYQKWNNENHADWTGQGDLRGQTASGIQSTPLFLAPLIYHNGDTYTWEGQAIGAIGPFNYATGLFYFHDRYAQSVRNLLISSLDATGTLATVNRYGTDFSEKSESKAAYAQVTYTPAALEALKITGGVRYTEDVKSASDPVLVNGVLAVDWAPPGKSWSNISEAFSVSYDWTPDAMAYARIANAYRAGGFNNLVDEPYDPEYATTYEVGFKSQLLDRRLLFNVAVFKTNYRDLQISQYDGSTVTIATTNAGRSTFEGFELETQAILGGGWRLRAELGYVDPKYKQYPLTTAGGQLINVSNEAKFPYVSKLTGNIGVQYENDTLLVQIDNAYRSSQDVHTLLQITPYRDLLQAKAFDNLTARCTIKKLPFWATDKLRVEFWGDNLLGDDHQIAGTDRGGYATVVYGRPRTYGVNLSARF